MSEPSFDIPVDAWSPNSTEHDDQRLSAVVRVCGVRFHAEAIPVEVDEHGQTAICFVGGSRLEGLCEEFDVAGFHPIIIDGCDYVVVLTPFGS